METNNLQSRNIDVIQLTDETVCIIAPLHAPKNTGVLEEVEDELYNKRQSHWITVINSKVQEQAYSFLKTILKDKPVDYNKQRVIIGVV